MSNFVSDWFGKPRKRKQDLSRMTVKANRWDLKDLEHIIEQYPEFGKARDKLSRTVSTAYGAASDTWVGFYKAVPEREDDEDVSPNYLIDAHVRDELWKMPEWAEFRALGTVGDEVSSAFAFTSMVDALETVFDRFKKERALADEYTEKLDELEALQQQAGGMQEALAGLDPDSPEAAAAQAALQGVTDEATGLQDAMEQLGEQIAEGLDGKRHETQQSLRKGLKDATETQEELNAVGDNWGSEPGEFRRLPADERLALAKKIRDNQKLLAIAKLIGPMRREMFAQQRERIDKSPEEFFSIETGNNLALMLPLELLYMQHPILKYEFYRHVAEAELLQYELRGSERLGQGRIIMPIDGSGSMQGPKEIWAKALGIALLNLARQQERAFTGIHFGSKTQFAEYHFVDPGDYAMEHVIDFAECFFGGGTDFVTPLTLSLGYLQEEHRKFGAIRGDIIFVTDGMAQVPRQWLDDFKAEQARLGFNVFGVLIGGHNPRIEPLAEICDGRVFTVHDLMGPGDVSEMFGQIHGPQYKAAA